jgi:hypothetical protein
MKTFRRAAVITALLAVVLGVLVGPGSATDSAVNKDLAAARRATARFHDVSVALDEGYVADPACVANPAGAAMGVHYFNQALAQDPALDVSHPEILLYVPGDDGPRLVGVEYFKAAPDKTPGPPYLVDPNGPELFGQHFNGPMAGHNPQMPTHYDLHVWIWSHNPDGTFAQFNPSLSC